MDATLSFVVLDEHHGERLDKLVAHHAGVSRRIARLWIRGGRVRVKGRVLRVMTKPISKGCKIEVEPEEVGRSGGGRRQTGGPDPRIIHIDDWLVAVDKPAGLLSETDQFGAPAVETVLPGVLRAAGHSEDAPTLVHRLDAGTSGVLLLARIPQAVRRLNESFRRSMAKKRYLALVPGNIMQRMDINEPIAKTRGTKQRVGAGGKPSSTVVIPLARSRHATLVEARPRTGRTHQIRVHLAHVGHPIAGDRLYGGPGYAPSADNRPSEPIPRAMLHAWMLEIPHPRDGQPLRLRADPPPDFMSLREALELGTDPIDDD